MGCVFALAPGGRFGTLSARAATFIPIAMALAQIEADRLLRLPKSFSEDIHEIVFSLRVAFDQEYELTGGSKGRERFLLDLERGQRKRIRLKYQTRAQNIHVLARLDIHGRPHRNPPDAPYRPGHRFAGHHVHVYREGFADRIAYSPDELDGFTVPAIDDDVSWLEAFLAYCNVAPVPQIQVTF